MTSWYNDYGYDVEVNIGGYTITTDNETRNNGLCEELSIVASAGNARSATFSFIPPEESIDITKFIGKTVKIHFRTAAGWEQVFDGFVDEPIFRFTERKITLKCFEDRSDRIVKLPLGVVSNIGQYSEAIFGKARNQEEELKSRMLTVASDFDFDRFGNYAVTSWAPKATADFTYSAMDIFRNEDPKVNNPNPRKVINTYNINIIYSYQRLHQRSCIMTWSGFGDFLSWYENGRPEFPARSTIASAAGGSDWKLNPQQGITFGPVFPATIIQYGDGVLVWQPNQVTEETRGKTKFAGYVRDSLGNFVYVTTPPSLVPHLVPIYEPVLDENGKQVMEVVKRTITDTTSHLCVSAQWQASLKYGQTIKENYNIKLVASQAVALYGEIPAYDQFNLQDNYDTSTWEKSTNLAAVDYNFYVNTKSNYPDLQKAIQVALSKAKREILNNYRTRSVGWRFKNLQPTLDLKHTVSVDINESVRGASSYIHAKGKVDQVSHYVNFTTTEAYSRCTLKLSQSTGSGTDAPWVIPSPIEQPNYIGAELQTISLGTYLGVDPAVTPGTDKYTGWIADNTDRGGNKTAFGSKFVVDYPPVPPNLRDEQTYYSEIEFDLAVPNDFFETSF